MSVSSVAPPARAELRRARVRDGLEELDRWLVDQIRTGLASLPKLGYPHFDAIAARMIDAQAPGLAGVLRSLPGELDDQDWPEQMLHALAGVHLLSQAHGRLHELPADLAGTVRSRIGYPVAKADVLAGPPLTDSWWAVGAVDVVDATLRRRRIWLRGATTASWAVWLTFAPPGQSFDDSVLPGTAFTGDLHFYPGSGQHRALVGRRGEETPSRLRIEGASLAEAQRQFADLVAADPWASRMPVALRARPLRGEDGSWWLRDDTGTGCPMLGLEGQPWPLLAQSGGEPLIVFGEWTGSGLRPLSVLPDDHGRTLELEICG